MKEEILCAAIQYHDRNNGVFAGRNHAECIREFHKIMNLKQYQAGKYTQGFLTTKGNFVNRKDAAEIHKSNGGSCNYFGGNELDSSDLKYMNP